MQPSTLSLIFTLLAAVSQAAPTSVPAGQVFNVALEFNGAAGASFSISVPTDNQPHPIDNPLSVSSISSPGGGFCSFSGAHGFSAFLAGAGTVVVSPPQTLFVVDCDNA